MKEIAFYDILKRFLYKMKRFSFVLICLLFLSGCSSPNATNLSGESDNPLDNVMIYTDDGSACCCNVVDYPISIPFGSGNFIIDEAILVEWCEDYEYSSAIVVHGDCSSLSDADFHWLLKEKFSLSSYAWFSDDDCVANSSGGVLFDGKEVFFSYPLVSSSRYSVSECERINADISYSENDISYIFIFDIAPGSVQPLDTSSDERITSLEYVGIN